MSKNYIPAADKTFLTWVINFLRYLFNFLTKFGVPDEKYQELATQREDFSQKLEIAEEPATRTKLTIQAKNDSRKVLEANIRQTVNQYLASNPAVSNTDRDGLGIPIRSKSRHPAPVADKAPLVVVAAYGPRQLKFDFGESEGSKAKPAGQHGTEIASVISDTKPAEVEDLTRSSFDTHTPLTLTFKESERGKTLWYAARWENTTGEKGPWGEIASVVIP
jgi:hypothetical protein